MMQPPTPTYPGNDERRLGAPNTSRPSGSSQMPLYDQQQHSQYSMNGARPPHDAHAPAPAPAPATAPTAPDWGAVDFMALDHATTFGEAARLYAAAGIPVFPVGRNKNPIIPKAQGGNGFLDATTEQAQIDAWARTYPDAGVGVPTGEVSGIFVVDVDPRHSGDYDKLAARFDLDMTLTSATGGDGYHLAFAHPGFPVSNDGMGKILGAGYDLRGDGSYIVVAPSVHASGRRYRWLFPCAPVPAPESLLALVRPMERPSRAETPKGPHDLPDEQDRQDRQDAGEFWLAHYLPDAREGNRNNAGFLLALQLRDSGLPIEEAERFMLAYAASVPQGSGQDGGEAYRRGEALATLRSVYKRPARPSARASTEPAKAYEKNEFNENRRDDATDADDETEEDDEDSLNSLNSFPDPMDAAAFIGPLGRFVLKIAPETEAAPEALLMQGLVAVGNAMGRGGHCVAEADEHHTNLYAVIVAGTGARKGTAWGHIRRFLNRAAPQWVDGHIVGGLSSGEGLINAVRDDAPAIPNKVVLAYEPEFSSVFKVKGREGSILSTTLRQGWDGSTLASLTKASPLRATGTHISVVGHITPEELRHEMSRTDATNGFANRILWVCARRARFLPEGGHMDEASLNSEVAALQEALKFAGRARQITRDDEATALWVEEYPRLTTPRAGVLGQVTGRAEAQVLRLSLLYALMDCSPVITARHLRAALAIWRYCLDSATFIFGGALGDPLAEKLCDELRQRGAAGMTRSEMFAALSRNASADAITRALATLEEQGLAVRRREMSAGGRHVLRWYGVGEDGHNKHNGHNGPDRPPDKTE